MALLKTSFQLDFKQDPALRSWVLLLNHKPYTTKAGQVVAVPTEALASSYQQEWNIRQGKYKNEEITFQTLIFTAIDKIAKDRSIFIKELVQYAATDLILYQQNYPDSLKEKETFFWTQWIEWVNELLETNFMPVFSLSAPPHDQQDLVKIENYFDEINDFDFSGLYALTQITGSVFLSLAFYEKELDQAQLLEACQLHENFQAMQWGKDQELEIGQLKMKKEIQLIATYFQSLD